MCGYREELVAVGHEVKAKWLDGANVGVRFGGDTEVRALGVDAVARIEAGSFGSTREEHVTLCRLAAIDLIDAQESECFISFTEPPDSDASRGGRHVEFGVILGLDEIDKSREGGHRVIVVGHRENIFHWMPVVEFAPTWEDAKELIGHA